MPVCPQCGAELGSGDPAGLCPKCLIQAAFDTSLGAAPLTKSGSPTAPAGDNFGRYEILRPIGEGGMGTVYLAEQREPIRRRVAIKIVKLGMDTRHVLARFANERQALALMDHPNIARIFDAGATPKGRPYFVMEYIDGAPITKYCDDRQLAIRQRLELFLAVCRALQHAHQRGVIHRDLKPSNVLVAEHDGAPVPKVIDFGIAKATDQWAVENTQLTEFGQMVGTPEYASPEQAGVLSGDISESTDVYSLGVLLYELLIGAVPFDGALLRKSGYAEMLRILREEEPPPLPRKLTTIGAEAATVAAHRQCDPASLRRLVAGDLNAITLKALEKEPGRRYASAAGLAADIHRYLAHRPVLASPPGVLYRTRKFLRRHNAAALGAAAGLGFALLSTVTLWSLARSNSTLKPKLTGEDSIVLADFDNRTGDPVFDDTLRQGLSVELQQSPFLSLVSDRQVRQTLALMGAPKDARLTPETAMQVCQRAGSALVLEGSITRLGSRYVLALRASNCTTGNLVDQEQAQAPRREDVLTALTQIARKFRTAAGESLATVEKHSTPLAEATTSSLDALKAYSIALKVDNSAGNAACIPFYRRAVEIDPQFAMAYAGLSLAYSGIGESSLSAENTTRAWQLRHRVSDPEKFFIDFTYNRQVTGNLEKAYRILESWFQTYPRGEDPSALDLLSAISTNGTGRFERAIEAAQQKLSADPNFIYAYENLAYTYFFLDGFSEAERTLEQASARNLQSPELLVLQFNIAALQGDQDRMNRLAARAGAEPGAEDWMAHEQALALARSGRLQAARRFSSRAVDLAVEQGYREKAARYLAARAVWEAAYGRPPEAQRLALSALELSRGRDVEYAAGLALAFSKDTSRSESLAADLEKRLPEDTFAKFTYVPVLRALAALARRRPADSIGRLQTTLTYELAVNGLNWSDFCLGGLHSAYVRGESFLATRRYPEAAAEFQKLLDHRGLVGLDPLGVLARLQLARALAASGDRAKSAAVYKDLLAIWKDADPDIPLVRQARAESAHLL